MGRQDTYNGELKEEFTRIIVGNIETSHITLTPIGEVH
jgi:hypothetical protein